MANMCRINARIRGGSRNAVTCKIEILVTTVNRFQTLPVAVKSSILGVIGILHQSMM